MIHSDEFWQMFKEHSILLAQSRTWPNKSKSRPGGPWRSLSDCPVPLPRFANRPIEPDMSLPQLHTHIPRGGFKSDHPGYFASCVIPYLVGPVVVLGLHAFSGPGLLRFWLYVAGWLLVLLLVAGLAGWLDRE